MNRLLILLFFAVIAFQSQTALAGVIELSGSFAYNSSTYGSTGFQWKRNWEASVGYYLSDLVEIELSAEDIVDRTVLTNIEDTTFHDQIYSIEFVQSLLHKSMGFQPFVKAGAGQLIREASGSYSGSVASPIVMGSLTGILGGGLRIFLHQQFSVKAEATTYLQNAVLSTWQNNFVVHFGFSFYF